MIHEALLSIGLLIVVAKLAEGLFRRLRLSSIVAYTATGIVLGPLTGIVEATAELHILLGIGVFFFFLIGLDEIDISSFVATIRGRFFVAAAVSMVISLFSALVVTSDEHTSQLTLATMLVLLGQIAAFTVVTWILSTTVVPPLIVLLQRFLNVPQLSFGLLLGGLFLMVVGAEEMGLLLVLLETQVIQQDVFSLLVLIMFGYILLTPMAISFALNRAKPSERVTLPQTLPTSLVRFALDDLVVDNILDRTRSYPEPTLSVRGFADRWIVPDQEDYVVVDDGTLAGIVSLRMQRYLPKDSLSRTPLGNMLRRDTPQASPTSWSKTSCSR